MINSIRYFEENSIKRFEELENNFMKNPAQMAEYILGIAEEGNRFLLKMIQETLESVNQMIITSPLRKRQWDNECHSSKQLTTSIGDVTFRKTLFVNKETGKSEYLYIEADEEHVSLQFRDKKRDLRKNENKNNCLKLLSQIRCKKASPYIAEEIRGHMESQI